MYQLNKKYIIINLRCIFTAIGLDDCGGASCSISSSSSSTIEVIKKKN